jgi:hypothetical protein
LRATSRTVRLLYTGTLSSFPSDFGCDSQNITEGLLVKLPAHDGLLANCPAKLYFTLGLALLDAGGELADAVGDAAVLPWR